MANDFSYRGISIGSYGVHFAPERADWHIWDSDFKTIDKSAESQDGGQWYGSTTPPKTFNLRCYFEEITEFSLAAVLALFGQSAYGELIFDERPWLTYAARVVKKPDLMKYPSASGTYSGTVTFNLTAYKPFALSDLTTLESGEIYPEFGDRMLATTGLMYTARMPVNAVASSGTPLTAQFTHYGYNAGDVSANTIIRIAGDVGTGVTIYNSQTEQTCKVIGLTAANTTNLSKWLEINSYTGESHITDGVNETLAHRYHDNGYVNLAPSAPIQRDVAIEYDANDLASFIDIFTIDSIGKYVYISNTWSKIISVTDAKNAVRDNNEAVTGVEVSDIVTLNKITITPVTTMSLTKFEIVHKHTFN